MLKVTTQDMCVWFPQLLSWVPAMVSGSGPSTISFMPGTPVAKHWASSQCARESLQPTPWYPLCRHSPNHLLPLPGSLALPHTGEHLRCTATARSKYCQKDLISSSHCLQNFFADLLTQVPLKAKQFAAGQQLMSQLPAPASAAMHTLQKTIWLSRSWVREPLVWWEREGGKPALLPPGELNSL